MKKDKSLVTLARDGSRVDRAVSCIASVASAASVGGLAVRLVVVAVTDVLVSLLEPCIGEEVAGTETLAQEEVYVYAFDAVCRELVGCQFAVCLYAKREDAEFVDTYGLALQQQFTQAGFHFDEHAAYCGLREYAVMICHVLDELVELKQFVYKPSVPLAVGTATCVLVLILFVL